MKHMIGIEIERTQAADLLVEVEAPDEATARKWALAAARKAVAARPPRLFRQSPEWYPDIDEYNVAGVSSTRYDCENYTADLRAPEAKP